MTIDSAENHSLTQQLRTQLPEPESRGFVPRDPWWKYWLKKISRHLSAKKIIFAVLVGLGLAILLASTISYFANMPRERADRNLTFIQRIRSGVNLARQLIVNRETTQQDPVAESLLPRIDTFIRSTDLDRLTEELPYSGQRRVKALIKIDGKIYRAKAKLRGDSMNHWAFTHRSWRFDLTRGKRWQGQKTINLLLPRADYQLENYLGYRLAEAAGIPAPRARFVHFRMNREFEGVRLQVEQLDDAFLTSRGFSPKAVLFVGDIESSDIYRDTRDTRLFRDLRLWRAYSIANKSKESRQPLKALIDAVAANNPFPLIDLPAFARFAAYLEIVGTLHIDNTHNNRLIRADDAAPFAPILWDPVAYLWGNTVPSDTASNLLMSQLYSDSHFLLLKDREVFRLLADGPMSTQKIFHLIDDTLDASKADFLASELKIHAKGEKLQMIDNAGWLASIKRLRKTIKDRNARLLGDLDRNVLAIKVRKESEKEYHITMSVKGRSPVTISDSGSNQATDLRSTTPACGPTKQTLFSGRHLVNGIQLRWTPRYYFFTLKTAPKITATNAVTNHAVKIVIDSTLPDLPTEQPKSIGICG